METQDRKTRAQSAMQKIKDAGQTPDQVALALNGRIASRTLYRWLSGKTDPQRDVDVQLIEDYAAKLT